MPATASSGCTASRNFAVEEVRLPWWGTFSTSTGPSVREMILGSEGRLGIITEATVQVHGVGPFQIHWKGGLHTLDDADARTTFRLAKGARVSSERGAASIVQGYASGKIIQYELEGADGARFMADEGALTPQ